jgi:hypothetical protein
LVNHEGQPDIISSVQSHLCVGLSGVAENTFQSELAPVRKGGLRIITPWTPSSDQIIGLRDFVFIIGDPHIPTLDVEDDGQIL